MIFYHGTTKDNWVQILKEGTYSINRNMYNIRGLELSEDTKRKIMDLVTDDLVARLEQLKKQFEEL